MSSSDKRKRTWLPWLRLFRPPNLFTVPGDPLVGHFLASSEARVHLVYLWPSLVASLLLYATGLLTNDLFDIEEDRRERPERPLPSGAVSLTVVALVACVMGSGGILVASLSGWRTAVIAAALIALIGMHNGVLKSVRFVGPLTMGMCRGMSLLMGASAVPDASVGVFPVVVSSAALAAFIAMVTFVAQYETGQRELPLVFLWAIPMIVGGWITVLIVWVPLAAWTITLATCFGAMAFGWMVFVSHSLTSITGPLDISAGVGKYLSGLLLIQATLCWLWVAPAPINTSHYVNAWSAVAAGVLAAAFPAARWTAKRFYAS